MQKFFLFSAGLLWAFSAAAQVTILSTPIKIDGKLDDAAWKEAPVKSGFTPLANSGKKKPQVQTEFRVLADKNNICIGILCKENNMQRINRSPNGDLWSGDGIEMFLFPSGQSDEFYQFVVTSGNNRYSMFYGESGVIRPDPFAPFWESAVAYGRNFWSVEVRIPLSSFYMTRNSKWSSQWIFNISRSRPGDLSSWSPLQMGFLEPRNFRKIRGFPGRAPEKDLFIKSIKPQISAFADGIYSGSAILAVEACHASAGRYLLTIEEPGGKTNQQEINIAGKLQNITVKNIKFLKNNPGKTRLKLTLKNLKNGEIFGRTYPVDLIYDPVKIVLETPGYKNNFYPGENSAKIKGKINLQLSQQDLKKAELFLSANGNSIAVKNRKLKLSNRPVPFEINSSALPPGGKVTLTATLLINGKVLGKSSKTVKHLMPNKGSEIRIENRVLLRNGKKYYPRSIYARYYRGGSRFEKRYNADDLGETPFKTATLEPARLIRGIEAKEATRDVKPCKELFEAVRKVVERSKNDPAFDFYYISDEPECRNISPVYLKYIYDFVTELDPYHPLITCSRSADRYMNCADIFSVHPYLNPVNVNGRRYHASTPIAQVRSHIHDITKFKRSDKVTGFTGQFFSYKFNNLFADYPTWEEIECMSWSAIAHESRLHYPYAYHDLGDRPHIYEGYRYVNQSIKALEGLLLSNRKFPVKKDDPENMIDTLLVEHDSVTLLIAVNLKNAPVRTVLRSEHLEKFKSLLEFRGTGSKKIVNGTLLLDMKPYECVVLTSKKMDHNLKTRAQVLKEIRTQENARRSRGNLLFEKGNSFEVDSSNGANSAGLKNKMFDGTLDMLAWDSGKGRKSPWFELNFMKRPPRFSKAMLHGTNLGNTTVKIWKFGEWIHLKPRKVTKNKYSILLDFGEELRSVKVHFAFNLPAKKKTGVELYEIELLK